MAKINVLEKHIAELIAAGEVVERPSSVVKELAENAIDAGASSVTIEIQNGGVTYIRVTDNGSGIAREDVPLAFLRHATSKIAQQDDLAAIGTLGFRGEALASICAMARVELLTRTEEELAGTRYLIEGGDEQLIEDAGCPRGTTVVVRDLFFNTPARMKFLKKDVSEGNAVAGVVDKLALSHPEVAVRFVRDGRETLRTPGDGKLRSAVLAVHGRDFVNGLVPVEYRMGGMSVEGFVSRPAAARPSRSMQTFFINGRFVKSQTASAAVEQACRGAVMVGKFPSCVLHLHIPAESVDVNVHPAKIEVRFMTERPVFDIVYRAVCDALGHGDAPKELQWGTPAPTPSKPRQTVIPLHEATPAPKLRVADNTENYIIEMPQLRRFAPAAVPKTNEPTEKPSETATAESTAPRKTELPLVTEVATTAANANVPPEPINPPKPTVVLQKTEQAPEKVQTPPAVRVEVQRNECPEQITVPLPASKTEAKPALQQQTLLSENAAKPKLRFVGEVFATYMMLEAVDEVIFIDKHAAHERILYEKLRKDTANRFAQQLLTPAVIHPAREEAAVLLEHCEELRAAGFELEEFGDGTLVVRSAPMLFAEQDVAAALTEIAAHLLAHRTELTTAHEEWILHNVACRAAIKAGDTTAPEELLALAQQLHERPELRYCPHGRPIYLAMKRRELEKQFGRIQ